MKIDEWISANGHHVWVVIESAVEGREIETGFSTKVAAQEYRKAVLALRRARRGGAASDELVARVDSLRRIATATYGHDR
jgi:hypothetical protein